MEIVTYLNVIITQSDKFEASHNVMSKHESPYLLNFLIVAPWLFQITAKPRSYHWVLINWTKKQATNLSFFSPIFVSHQFYLTLTNNILRFRLFITFPFPHSLSYSPLKCTISYKYCRLKYHLYQHHLSQPCIPQSYIPIQHPRHISYSVPASYHEAFRSQYIASFANSYPFYHSHLCLNASLRSTPYIENAKKGVWSSHHTPVRLFL